MIQKEIKARYKHTAFGFLWTILNPLMQMTIIGTVFQFFVPVKVDNYFVFLFAGLLAWDFFTSTITRNTPLYVYERFLLQKSKFPREIVFLAIVGANSFHFIISVVLFWVIGVIWFNLSLGWHLLALGLGMVWLMGFSAGLSALLTSLNVRFRDVDFAVKAGLPLWFYVTPVMYTIQLLPSQWRWVFNFNPMAGIIEIFRFALLGVQPSSLTLIGWNLLISIGVMILGGWTFKKLSPHFVDWL
jgi:ABC-type polysaccharide/polyol phosphate export permease